MFETINYAMYKVYGRDWGFYNRISGFKFTEDENGLYLNVSTYRPGRLIGKMGSKIEELEKVLSLVFLKDTHIKIEETPELYGLKINENY
jgi:ribosomal protein S3